MKKITKIFTILLASSFFLSNFINSALAEKSAKLELKDRLFYSYQAAEIQGINKWFNSNPLKISQLKGKVVLIDFWTYSCINCVRTLPYMKKLHEKYADKGLVIIGIHSPEFDFEKNEKNVEKAIERFGIKYAVAMDNDMKTWQNFDNHYWPAHYLIDQNGKVVYSHFGEGKYDVMENNVAALLEVKNAKIEKDKKSDFSRNITHETYLGVQRAENNYNDQKSNFTFPKTLPTHGWALSGKWQLSDQFIESKAKGDSLKINFNSKKVYLVMSSKNKNGVKVKVKLNDKNINLGADVANSELIVKEDRLYELVDLKKFGNGILEIESTESGLRAYAFTFGN